MARIENWYKQDLKKPVPIRRMETVFNQDALGHLFGVEVYDNGEAVALAGSVTGYCLLADGTTVPVAGTRSGNKASIIIPQTAYSVIGPITITVKLTEGTAITTLLAVVGMVARSRTGQQVDPGSTVTDWTNQISAQLQNVQTAADNLGSTLAQPFSTMTAYTAGTYVMNGGNLYRFTSDHAAGEWDSSHVTAVKLAQEVTSLNQALNIVDGIVFQAFDYSGLDASTLNINASDNWQTNTNYATYYFPVPEKAKIMRVIGNAANGTPVAFLADSDPHKHNTGVVYATGGEKTTVQAGKEEALTIPDDAAYVFFAKIISGTDYEPVYIGFNDAKVDKVSERVATLETSTATMRTEIDENAQAIISFESSLNVIDETIFNAYDYSEIDTSPLNINASNKWQTGSAYITYYFAVPKNAKVVRIIANATNGTNVALIAAADKHKHATSVVYATGWEKTFVSAGQEAAFEVPDDCAYIWFAKQISGTVYEPVYVGFYEDAVSDISDLKNRVTDLETDKSADSALATGFIYGIPDVRPLTGENKIIDGDAYDQFDNIIALWDALLTRGNQYGTYVTKCWIDGTAYDNTEKIMSDLPTAGDHNPRSDMNQYPLIMYKFKPYLFDAQVSGKPANKKILIVSGTHGPGSDGDHLESPVACYYFAKRLIEDFGVSDSLINIRNNYEIDFIPVANPWGINNRTRRNGQNIDINRDYSAFTTVTAQQIKNLVDSGEYQMLIDSHCLGGTSLTGGSLAGAHYRFFTRNAAVSVIGQQLTNFIGAKYSVPTTVDTGTTSTTTYYANSAGIIGITTEIPANTPLYYGDRTGEPHGKDVVEHDVDYIQNVIAVMSNYLRAI